MLVEGVNPGEVELQAEYKYTKNPTVIVKDIVKVSVVKVNKIPIGKSAQLSKTIYGKIYIPSKWGGTLYLKNGQLELFYTDGSDLTGTIFSMLLDGLLDSKRIASSTEDQLEYEIPENKKGWYYVKCCSDEQVVVESQYIEQGESAIRPWNGWYWPKLDEINPNLYDLTGDFTPLKDYDSVYKTNAVYEEKKNYFGGDSWEGHCWGWALASQLIKQPLATKKNEVSFNQDEMEGLYTELADGATIGWEWLVGDPDPTKSKCLPYSPCTQNTGEPIDDWPAKFHNVLCNYIKVQKLSLFGDLRDQGGLKSNQVWNHPIFGYASRFKETELGNEKIIEILTVMNSSADTPAMPDNESQRSDFYLYVVEYNSLGTLIVKSKNQNWIECEGFPPACIGKVRPEIFIWKSEHTSITKENVDKLYKK